MYGYIYKTTNLLNYRFYIGQHKSAIFDKNYFGSGKIIKKAIKKYGKENFEIEIVAECEDKLTLDEKEKEFIKRYKELYPQLCYNLAQGGDGGDVFYYQSEENKNEFIQKMTKINKVRCSSPEFRKKISQSTSKRYQDSDIRAEHSKKVKQAWSNKELREKQSNKLKEYYSVNPHDCSFNKIRCCFELGNIKIVFDSIAELRDFLIEQYSYNPDRHTFQRLMEEGKQGKVFVPFHKNKLKRLIGMKIYKIDDDVETNRDECSGVEAEISTAPKDEAQ